MKNALSFLLLQYFFKYAPRINFLCGIFFPIVCLWNLSIQQGFVFSYKFPLRTSDFFLRFVSRCGMGMVQHIKIDTVSLAVCFCQYAIFLLFLLLDSYIMLRDTP